MDLVTMIMACSLYGDNAIVNAVVETGSQNNPLKVTTVLEDGSQQSLSVPNPVAGAAYVNKQLAAGHDVYIGLMQIPSGWLNKYQKQASLVELFRPCKNMVIATRIMNHAMEICAKHLNRDPQCDLAIYRFGKETPEGKSYADKILDYAQRHPVAATPKFEAQQQEEERPNTVLPKILEIPEPQFRSLNESQPS